MRLFCSFGWHRPSSSVVPNDGRLFSRCTACHADIIMVGRGWRTAPKGFQVVWKEPSVEPPLPAPGKGKKERKAGPARRRGDRRVATSGELPSKLGGKDRRRSGDRRKGFGKKPDTEE